MKYYNPSNNFRAPIPREPKPYKPPQPRMAVPELKQEPAPANVQPPETPLLPEKDFKNQLFGHMDADDILLLGLIFILLVNGCEDYLLLAILGYLFFSGKNKIK